MNKNKYQKNKLQKIVLVPDQDMVSDTTWKVIYPCGDTYYFNDKKKAKKFYNMVKRDHEGPLTRS